MTRQERTLSIAATVLLSIITVSAAWAQIDQGMVARRLLDQEPATRDKALEAARQLGPKDTGPELRSGLIGALVREGQVLRQRYEADQRGEVLKDSEAPEFIAKLARVVAELRDPQAIPALTGALGIGSSVTLALAGFGERAAPAVLGVVMSPDSPYEAVNDGLIALRSMVEHTRERPLSEETMEKVRRAAEQHLAVPGRPYGTGITLRWAIDLAVALNDPNLRRAVETLASDPNELISRGITDPQLIEQTQKRATDRLAGVLPSPRP